MIDTGDGIAPSELDSIFIAAIAIDSDLILQLIEQISSEETNLAQGLTKMLKSFKYEEIIELAQQELERRDIL